MKDIRLIYVMGFSYSGSTLLSFLLNAHSRVGSIGELDGPPGSTHGRSFVCSCGLPLHDCPFYALLDERLRRVGHSLLARDWSACVYPHPLSLGRRALYGSLRNSTFEHARDMVRDHMPVVRAYPNTLRRCNGVLIRAVCRLMSVDTIVDTSKKPMRLALLRKLPGVQIRVIHLVRHPIGSVFSGMKYHDISALQLARTWQRTQRTCLRQVSGFDGADCMTLRYEDLCEDPQKALSTVCEFMNVAYESTMLEFQSAEHHIIGNKMRVCRNQEIRLDESWRDRLSESEKRNIWGVVGKYAGRFGYHDWN